MKKYQFFDTNKINTLEELKKVFKTLAFKHHPDRGGKVQDFQSLNNEYEILFEIYKNKSTNKQEQKEDVNTFKDIINKFMHYDNIIIEVVGYWIWIKGQGTYNIKEVLKENNFFYSSKHKCYMHNGDKKRKVRNKYNEVEIKQKYGCTVVKNEGDNNDKGGNNKPPKKLK